MAACYMVPRVVYSWWGALCGVQLVASCDVQLVAVDQAYMVC